MLARRWRCTSIAAIPVAVAAVALCATTHQRSTSQLESQLESSRRVNPTQLVAVLVDANKDLITVLVINVQRKGWRVFVCPGTSKLATSMVKDKATRTNTTLALHLCSCLAIRDNFVSFIDHLFELTSHFTITNPALHTFGRCEQ